MQKAGVVEQRMFSFYLTNYMDKLQRQGSRLLFGGYDMKYAQPGAKIRWAPLISTDYWMVKMSYFGAREAPPTK